MAAPAAPNEVTELTGPEGEVTFPTTTAEAVRVRVPTETVVSEEIRNRMLAELAELPSLLAQLLELHRLHPRTYKSVSAFATALMGSEPERSVAFTRVELAAWKAVMLMSKGLQFPSFPFTSPLRIQSTGVDCTESLHGRKRRLLLLLVLLVPQYVMLEADKNTLRVDRDACANADAVVAAFRDGILVRLRERLEATEIVVL